MSITLKKGQNTEIRFTIERYNGRQYCDVRLWFRGKKTNMEWRRTRKGVTFEFNQAQDFVECAMELAEQVDQL